MTTYQKALFDFAGPAARRSDPESSHAAAALKQDPAGRNIGEEEAPTSGPAIGSADSDRERIYNLVRLWPGHTSGELAAHLAKCYPHERWDNVRVTRRTSELKKSGRIATFGNRPCAAKGTLMEVYVIAIGPEGNPRCCTNRANHVWVKLDAQRDTGECRVCGVALGTRKREE